MACGFGEYAWSLRFLDRRLSYFNINRNDKSVLNQLLIRNWWDQAGIGFPCTHLKIKHIHGLNVRRDLVYTVMTDLDSDGLKTRQPGNKKSKEKNTSISAGPNWVMSLDGHDKLMGFQNNTFPIALYGAIDTVSIKLLWIKVWVTKNTRISSTVVFSIHLRDKSNAKFHTYWQRLRH